MGINILQFAAGTVLLYYSADFLILGSKLFQLDPRLTFPLPEYPFSISQPHFQALFHSKSVCHSPGSQSSTSNQFR